jgi:rhodanese-related sulfurtransferase
MNPAPTTSDRAPVSPARRRGAFRESLIIVLVGTVLGLVANTVSPRGIPLVGDFSRGAALANRSAEELAALPAEIELAGVQRVVEAIAARSADEDSAPAADAASDNGKASPKAEAGGDLEDALLSQAVLIDARSPDIYGSGHIPGALNLPVSDFDAAYPEFKAQLKTASLIVVYCDGGDCELSHDLATMLKDLGHGPIQLFAGGFDAWMEAGHDMRAGQEP